MDKSTQSTSEQQAQTGTKHGYFILHCEVIRTQMIGGGTSYDVYVPVGQKAYRPITGHVYATIICHGGREYYRLDDFLRTVAMDGLPSYSEERWNAFKRLKRVSDRLEARLAKRAFPELGARTKLPTLWADWTVPSAQKRIRFRVNGRNYARVCGL